jgi:hypothetical protein
MAVMQTSGKTFFRENGCDLVEANDIDTNPFAVRSYSAVVLHTKFGLAHATPISRRQVASRRIQSSSVTTRMQTESTVTILCVLIGGIRAVQNVCIARKPTKMLKQASRNPPEFT